MKDENNLKSITVKQLEWLLDGLEMNPKNYHKEVKKRSIILANKNSEKMQKTLQN